MHGRGPEGKRRAPLGHFPGWRFFGLMLSRQTQSYQDIGSGKEQDSVGHEEVSCWMLERGHPELLHQRYFSLVATCHPAKTGRASVCKTRTFSPGPATHPFWNIGLKGKESGRGGSWGQNAQEFIENQRLFDYYLYVLGT